MDPRLIFLCLFLLIAKGVCGDEVKSVMEGKSVTLHTNTVLQSDDVIKWTYGSEHAFVAVINREAGISKLSDDERFKDKVTVDFQTGNLMISDTKTEHSGLYHLWIKSNKTVSYQTVDVTIHGVIVNPGEVKSVSVREGHSVTLYTGGDYQRGDVMEWRFGPENTLVGGNNITTSTQSPDERFRDGVKVDYQTGALMINDTRPHHSGLYQFRINSHNNVSYQTFNVTVHDSRVDSQADSPFLWVCVIPVVLLISVCICVWVCVRKCRDMKASHALKDEESSVNSSTTLYVEASRFPSSYNVNVIYTGDEKKMQENLI